MKISQEITVGLKRLCNKSVVSDNDFQAILRQSASVLSNYGAADDSYISQLEGARKDTLKEAYASAVTLLTEAARNDLSSSSFSSFLEAYNLSPSRLEELVIIYANCVEKIQQNLRLFNHCLPHVVDVKWRLDCCVKSNSSGGPGYLLYFVQFVCQSPDKSSSTIDFVCTVEQLREMVEKLKDANRKVEKIANLTK